MLDSLRKTFDEKLGFMGVWRYALLAAALSCTPFAAVILLPVIIFTSPVLMLAFIWWLMRQVAILHNPRSLVGPSKPVPRDRVLASCTGLDLYTYEWKTKKEPIGYVFISHGYGEHGARYNYVAERLNKAGYEVHALDHQGHGLSEGSRAYVADYKEFTTDILALVDSVLSKHSRKPRPAFLIGHSMGGGIAIHVANARPSLWSGVILSAPAIVPDPELATPFIRKISGLLSGTLPKLPLPGKSVGPEAVCRDPEIVEEYRTDPLVYHGDVLARTGAQLLKSMDDIMAEAPSSEWPFLMVHGTGDTLCLMEGSEYFYENAGSTDKTLKKYDGLFHEVFNEPERDQLLDDVIQWMEEHL